VLSRVTTYNLKEVKNREKVTQPKQMHNYLHCYDLSRLSQILRIGSGVKARCKRSHYHIYEKPFAPDNTRIRDHCHLVGHYCDPAYSNCSLNYKNSFYIPIVFHNLSSYNSHFIIMEIATAFKGIIDVLPITKEKYISFTKHIKNIAEKSDSRNCVKLRFIDSNF